MIRIDNRGLTPPQPMMRTLAALEELEEGESLEIMNDRRPMFLFAELDQLGYAYKTEEQPDGSFKITITKGSKA